MIGTLASLKRVLLFSLVIAFCVCGLSGFAYAGVGDPLAAPPPPESEEDASIYEEAIRKWIAAYEGQGAEADKQKITHLRNYLNAIQKNSNSSYSNFIKITFPKDRELRRSARDYEEALALGSGGTNRQNIANAYHELAKNYLDKIDSREHSHYHKLAKKFEKAAGEYAAKPNDHTELKRAHADLISGYAKAIRQGRRGSDSASPRGGRRESRRERSDSIDSVSPSHSPRRRSENSQINADLLRLSEKLGALQSSGNSTDLSHLNERIRELLPVAERLKMTTRERPAGDNEAFIRLDRQVDQLIGKTKRVLEQVGENFNRKIHELEAAVERVKAELGRADSTSRGYQQLITQYNKLIDRINAMHREEIIFLRSQIEHKGINTEAERAQLEERLREVMLEEEIRALKQTHETMSSQHQKEIAKHKARITALEAEAHDRTIATTENSIREIALEAKIQKLRLDYESIKAKTQKDQQNLEILTKVITRLNDDAAKRTSGHENAEAARARLEAELAQVRNQLTGDQTDRAEIQAQIERIRAENNRLKEKIEQERAGSKTFKEEHDKVKAKLERMERDLADTYISKITHAEEMESLKRDHKAAVAVINRRYATNMSESAGRHECLLNENTQLMQQLKELQLELEKIRQAASVSEPRPTLPKRTAATNYQHGLSHLKDYFQGYRYLVRNENNELNEPTPLELQTQNTQKRQDFTLLEGETFEKEINQKKSECETSGASSSKMFKHTTLNIEYTIHCYKENRSSRIYFVPRKINGNEYMIGTKGTLKDHYWAVPLHEQIDQGRAPLLLKNVRLVGAIENTEQSKDPKLAAVEPLIDKEINGLHGWSRIQERDAIASPRSDLARAAIVDYLGYDLERAENTVGSANDINNCIKNIFDQVRELHRNGILSRDIKRQNILFTQGTDDPCLLMDFGAAVVLNRNGLFKTSGINVTPQHFPEPLERERGAGNTNEKLPEIDAVKAKELAIMTQATDVNLGKNIDIQDLPRVLVDKGHITEDQKKFFSADIDIFQVGRVMAELITRSVSPELETDIKHEIDELKTIATDLRTAKLDRITNLLASRGRDQTTISSENKTKIMTLLRCSGTNLRDRVLARACFYLEHCNENTQSAATFRKIDSQFISIKDTHKPDCNSTGRGSVAVNDECKVNYLIKQSRKSVGNR